MFSQSGKVLFVCQMGAWIVMLIYYFGARPPILSAYSDYGTPLPPGAATALSGWFLPAAIGATLALDLAAMGLTVARRGKRPRAAVRLLSGGILISGAAIVFAVWVTFVPLFRMSAEHAIPLGCTLSA